MEIQVQGPTIYAGVNGLVRVPFVFLQTFQLIVVVVDLQLHLGSQQQHGHLWHEASGLESGQQGCHILLAPLHCNVHRHKSAAEHDTAA
jgi:hypothetical protein